ncbi:hypothetical protein [Sphaerisporangium aureirubrum]|uniref:Uncharacterized protein n=1 Tax=Sphaerisporangium aureirubrum TaxID=1544736 RepID=A0ABW1NCI6_9ACTN
MIPNHHGSVDATGHRTENRCPCPQEACGLVDPANADPDCVHHGSNHPPQATAHGHHRDECPGVPDPAAVLAAALRNVKLGDLEGVGEAFGRRAGWPLVEALREEGYRLVHRTVRTVNLYSADPLTTETGAERSSQEGPTRAPKAPQAPVAPPAGIPGSPEAAETITAPRNDHREIPLRVLAAAPDLSEGKHAIVVLTPEGDRNTGIIYDHLDDAYSRADHLRNLHGDQASVWVVTRNAAGHTLSRTSSRGITTLIHKVRKPTLDISELAAAVWVALADAGATAAIDSPTGDGYQLSREPGAVLVTLARGTALADAPWAATQRQTLEPWAETLTADGFDVETVRNPDAPVALRITPRAAARTPEAPQEPEPLAPGIPGTPQIPETITAAHGDHDRANTLRPLHRHIETVLGIAPTDKPTPPPADATHLVKVRAALTAAGYNAHIPDGIWPIDPPPGAVLVIPGEGSSLVTFSPGTYRDPKTLQNWAATLNAAGFETEVTGTPDSGVALCVWAEDPSDASSTTSPSTSDIGLNDFHDGDHDPEDPPELLDFDEVQELLDQAFNAKLVDDQRGAERRLHDALPELFTRLRWAERELARYHAAPATCEYAITDGEPPTPDTPRVTEEEAYSELHGTQPGVLWMQAHMTLPWEQLPRYPLDAATESSDDTHLQAARQLLTTMRDAPPHGRPKTYTGEPQATPPVVEPPNCDPRDLPSYKWSAQDSVNTDLAAAAWTALARAGYRAVLRHTPVGTTWLEAFGTAVIHPLPGKALIEFAPGTPHLPDGLQDWVAPLTAAGLHAEWASDVDLGTVIRVTRPAAPPTATGDADQYVPPRDYSLPDAGAVIESLKRNYAIIPKAALPSAAALGLLADWLDRHDTEADGCPPAPARQEELRRWATAIRDSRNSADARIAEPDHTYVLGLLHGHLGVTPDDVPEMLRPFAAGPTTTPSTASIGTNVELGHRILAAAPPLRIGQHAIVTLGPTGDRNTGHRFESISHARDVADHTQKREPDASVYLVSRHDSGTTAAAHRSNKITFHLPSEPSADELHVAAAKLRRFAASTEPVAICNDCGVRGEPEPELEALLAAREPLAEWLKYATRWAGQAGVGNRYSLRVARAINGTGGEHR